MRAARISGFAVRTSGTTARTATARTATARTATARTATARTATALFSVDEVGLEERYS